MAKLGDKCSGCPTLLTEDNCRKIKDNNRGKTYISHSCKTCYNVSRGFKSRTIRTHCKNEDCGVLLTDENSHWTYYTTKDGEKKKSRHSDCIKCSNKYSASYQKSKYIKKPKQVKTKTGKPLKKIVLGDKCKQCSDILTEENSVKYQRKGVPGIRGCCKTCENKKIQERNMKSGRVKTKRRKITHCKNEECGVLLTDENNVVYDGRVKSFCHTCYNANQRQDKAKRFVPKLLICSHCEEPRRKASMTDDMCKYCLYDYEVAIRTGQRLIKKYYNVSIPRPPRKRTKKLKKEIVEKALKETIPKVVTKSVEKLSARDKISQQIEQNEKARKVVNISASEKMIEKFLKKNKVQKDVQPMSNRVEVYTGELESTHTHIGNRSLINFD